MPSRPFTVLSALSLMLCAATAVLRAWTGPGAHAGDPPLGWEHLSRYGFHWKIVGVAETVGPIYATNVPSWWYTAAGLIFAIAPLLWVMRYSFHLRRLALRSRLSAAAKPVQQPQRKGPQTLSSQYVNSGPIQ